jgi:CDGSH-type Zn-finger protein
MAPKISVAEDGPLLVNGCERLLSPDPNQTLEAKPKMALCRCGVSKDLPYCDGSHKPQGFRGDKEDDRPRDKKRAYTGKETTVHFNLGICAHAAYCVTGLPGVFDVDKRPWVQPDNASAEEILDVVRRCPSGALSATAGNETAWGDGTAEAKMVVIPNGPLVVKGGVPIAGQGVAWAEGASEDHYTLCRCGKSKNKPFCDGTHKKAPFERPDHA